MPGAAACAVAANSTASAIITTGSRLDFEIAFFIFVALIAVPYLIDMNFGHQPTDIFVVVGQVVEVGGEEIEHAARWTKRCRIACGPATCIAGVQDQIQRLATTQRDRVGVMFEAVP